MRVAYQGLLRHYCYSHVRCDCVLRHARGLNASPYLKVTYDHCYIYVSWLISGKFIKYNEFYKHHNSLHRSVQLNSALVNFKCLIFIIFSLLKAKILAVSKGIWPWVLFCRSLGDVLFTVHEKGLVECICSLRDKINYSRV